MSETQLNLVNYFNGLLSPALFDDYAPNGLQIEGKTHLKRVAFAVSATQDSLKKALSWGADGIVVHHGILWKHQGARTITGGWGERVKLCIKNDLNLFSYHLPLDGHLEVGNGAALGRAMGLVNLAPFGLYKKAYLGAKGELSTPISAKDLKLKLKTLLHHDVILASPNEEQMIKSIGIITGGANNDWIKAQEEGLDAYLTGEISEYNWHDSIEAGIHYFAGGHHATERFGIKALMEKTKKDFPNLEVLFIDSENPA
jgi:dinuclear metal center YbgI/SA1388 family protein